ncbi:MAG: DUF5916 domain-containing protein [Bacteroidota bacterium]
MRLSAAPPLLAATALAALLLAAPALAAQTGLADRPVEAPAIDLDAPPALGAHAIEAGAIRLDGVLDEAAWAQAEVATGFVQNRPNPGEPASEPTEARVLYDGRALYVGMRMHDSEPDAIDVQLGRRDSYLDTDWAVVAIDSYDDDRTGFLFRINPAGVLGDILLFDDVNEDGSWNAVWDARASRDDGGWTAEFRIPLSQLRFASSEGAQSWGIEFGREHLRTNEQSFWAPLLPDVDGVVSRFGALNDLRGLQSPRRLELQPYLASSLTRAPGDDLDPFFAENDLDPRIGLDLKYGVTSDVTLTATVNPDFGQVEADPAQVNLGGFELFFEERRPFFVEGTDVFSMQPRRFFSMNRPDLLYTRRIGRAPQRTDFVPSAMHEAAGDNGAVYTDAPQQSTILGAAKLSGRVGRFSVGVLDAVTGPEYGFFQVFDEAGTRVGDDRALIEPTTNYAAARVRGTFGSTIVGALGTSVLRSTSNEAIAELLPTQATVLGIDLEHAVGDLLVTGQLAGSHVSGSADAVSRLQTAFPRLLQRPDASHLTFDPERTSLSGATGEINLLKPSGRWSGSFHAAFTSPGFDANELGFQSRADQIGVGGVVVHQQNEAQGPFQSWSANVFSGARFNTGGDHEVTFVGGNANGRFKNFWGVNVNGEVYSGGLSDRLTRGGPLAARARGFGINANAWSDDRKAVSGWVWSGMNLDATGDRFNGVEAGVQIRPSPSVSLSLGPELYLQSDPRQYVGSFDAPRLDATFGQRYVFGQIRQTTLALGTRLNWTFSPTLSLQTYVRPFVSRGRYGDFSQMTAPRQLDFPRFADAEVAVADDGEVTITPADGGDPFSFSPDFTVRALQGNAVLRWEYRPGSALFLVWQQQRNGFEPDGAFRVGRDLGGLFTDAPTNVFLVKFSYWLG